MSSNATQSSSYALGHSDLELDRLSRQAQALAPFTRQLFAEAGIKGGMRVLDVGCGSGDVTLLLAEMVGPGGEIVGADREPVAVEWARRRAKLQRIANVQFVEGDPADLNFDQAFDAVVGRLVLMYYPDPAAAVRKLARHVRSEGLVVFQEFDEENCRSMPNVAIFERSVSWIKETLRRTGAQMQMGLQLYPTFLAAGLPGPCLRMDALIGGGPDCPTYELVAEVIESLLPVMEKLSIAARDEVRIPTLPQRIRDEVVAASEVVLSPALIGAWARKPAQSKGCSGKPFGNR
jgi:SAM-dependent methyltransferase